MSKRLGIAIGFLAVVALVAFTPPGQRTAQQFFASLRIAKPKPVSVTIPALSGPSSNRRLQDAVTGMMTDTVSVTLDEPDQPAAGADAAGRLAGFPAQRLHARTDSASFFVLGAHAVSLTVHRAQLRTMLMQAGNPSAVVPPALEGAAVTLKTPRAIRIQHGHCPAPVANTLQNQLQGPPPATTDNGDCVVLVEIPATSAEVPPGLDMTTLTEIALELSGMSPNQAREFQKLFEWRSALSLPMPRFIRSYDSVQVNGTPGMLVNTAGRRGPAWQLVWTAHDLVYALVGYGSSADAVPLANSIH